MGERLINVYRGELVESIHNGTIVVVNGQGEVLHAVGDAQQKVYARSSMKLFQVIPAIEVGIVQNFQLKAKDISLFCASHNGEAFHTDTVLKNLYKASLNYSHLKCGTHPPRHIPTYEKLIREEQTICEIHNNCSGKHTGMLLTAVVNNESVENYYELNHPVQQRILKTISEVCEYPPEEIEIGLDGCGVPVHAIPLYNIALGYANLAANTKYTQARKDAISTIVQSIVEAPEMIGGTDRFCSDLIRVCAGKLVAKAGAEGVYCIGHLEKQLGIAIKIDDGNPRASYPVAMEVLKQLDLITADEYEQLSAYAKPHVYNVRKEIVGRIEPAFTLEREVLA